MTFGEKLFQLRTAAGLSQKALADAVGVAQGAVGHWETGLREPGWGSVQALCVALGVDCTVFQGCEPGGTSEKRGPGRPAAEPAKKSKGKKA